MTNKSRTAITIFSYTFLLFSLICLPYYLTFREFGISKNTASWGEYGSYIAGISAVLNLVVFIYLTIYVARLGNVNNKAQIITQKKIIISQFRQIELDKLSDQLDMAFNFNGIEAKESVITKFANSAKYLTNFLNQKKYLFPVIESQEIQLIAGNIIDKHSQFIDIVNEINGKQNLTDSQEEKLNIKVQATVFLKNELIEKLQMFILDDLGA